MTQTDDVHDAASSRPPTAIATRTSAGSGGSSRKYTNSFSVARASLLWVLLRRQKSTLKWLFIVHDRLLGRVALRSRTSRGAWSTTASSHQTAPLWPYVRYITFWALWAIVFGFAQQQIAERLSYQIEFDMRVWLYTHIQSAELRRLDAARQRPARHPLAHRRPTRRHAPADLPDADRLRTGPPRDRGHRHHHQPDHGRAVARSRSRSTSGCCTEFRHGLRALSWAELNERAEVTSAIDEPVRGIRVVKAFGREDKERARVADVTERAFKFSMSRARLLAGYDLYLKMMPDPRAGRAARRRRLDAQSTGRLTVGTFLLAFQLGTGLNSSPARSTTWPSAWQYLRSASGPPRRDARAQRPAGHRRPHDPAALDRVRAPWRRGHVRRPALPARPRRSRSRPGELVVVNGPPGSGKTTLAGDRVRAHRRRTRARPCSTASRSHDLDPAQLRQTIRVVSEEPLLLAATLRDNLLLGACGEIDDETMLDAMRLAGADEVIEELDGGLDGVVGDRGLTVSGGQRQRVSLARALVAHPRVLILDDALSAVNPSLEIEIMRRVRAVPAGHRDPLHHPANRPRRHRRPRGHARASPETVEPGRPRSAHERAARRNRRRSSRLARSPR